MNYIKVKDRNDLVRNPDTNCIINTNSSQYNEYINLREARKSENDIMKNELDDLKNEMNEIKHLLRSLVNGN
tara:strand:- start:351 stop:566 length:216 start_codon:yes stop_codon:yes gene_type:complete